VIPALLLLLACEAEPVTVAECARLGSRAEIEDCRFRLVAPLVGDDQALDAALADIPDPASRDLLLLRLAIADPPRAGRLCKRVETDGAETRCRQVLGRPHLSTTRRPPAEPAPETPPEPAP
jgi:hypothetical protein